MNLPSELVCHPTVFILGDTYQIITPVKSEMLFWIKVGDKKYYDHSNGILRSSTLVHKVVIPIAELDREKRYTVCYKKMIDRKPYFPESEETVEAEYTFKPLQPGKPIKLYHISDSHGRVEQSIAAAKNAFDGETDLLVLNGDISNHSSSVENISMIYKIASGITEGTKPCVYSRGNHDMRGAFAEHLAEYTPVTPGDGLTYFTFRVGDLWGIVLDCAEDKLDTNKEYGGTVCCHFYREAETEFLKEVAEKCEYNAEGIKHRIVIAHSPITKRNFKDGGIFDIEKDIYAQWVGILNEKIKPDLFLSGHWHSCEIIMPGDASDHHGQTFPVLIGAKPSTLRGEGGFTGTAITLGNQIEVEFTDSLGNTETAALIKKG